MIKFTPEILTSTSLKKIGATPAKKILMTFLFFATVYSTNAQCPAPATDPANYGVNAWIGAVYATIDTANPPTRPFTSPTTYRGFVNQPEMFDQNLGSGTLSGSNLCGTYSDLFAMRFRMVRNFPAGYYTFTVGGDDGIRLSFDGGATYEISDWNYHSYQTTTKTIYLSGTKYMVLDNYDQGGESRLSFSYTAACDNVSTAPTSILGIKNICAGASTTLTADGGTAVAGSFYQWGTGTVGSNIITGENGASITISPTAATTNYWVRRRDAAPCNTTTAAATATVTVSQKSTAPTTISGTTTLCIGNSTTLTASGGNHLSGAVYQWGFGTVGSNVIPGNTASITVSPNVSTTYWVRRYDNGTTCGGYTDEKTVLVTVNPVMGDQVSYGSNSWIGYVYANTDGVSPQNNAFDAVYRGYITQTQTFDQDWAENAVSGPNVCGSYANQFAVRYKMKKNFAAGYYNFTVGSDDGVRLSVNGGTSYVINNWTDHSYTINTTTSAVYLSGETNLVLEFFENTGSAHISFSYTFCAGSSAPTSVSGNVNTCSGANTTLYAEGGTTANGATYQWGTGEPATNILSSGQTWNGINVAPTTTTTYWVRRVDPAPCNTISPAFYQTVTVSTRSTQPTSISSTGTICNNGGVTLTAIGGILGTGSVYNWGTGYSVGSNVLTGETGPTLTVNPSAQTVYWVRRVDPAPCNTNTQGPTIIVSVPSTPPTSITGPSTHCVNSGSKTLTAVGGLLSPGGNYQWGSGTVSDANVLATNNNTTYNVNPSVTTTYWVRTKDAAPCNTVSAAVSFTITVSTQSTQPSSISNASALCNNGGLTLEAIGGTAGTGSYFEWGTGNTVGNNIISGENSATLAVNPAVQTVYWVRRVDPAPCSRNTGGPTITVTPASTAPTSINGTSNTTCSGTQVTLTAIGALATANNYQWGTGTTLGQSQIGGSGSSINVSPTTTTTYWVRRIDYYPCNAPTDGAFFTITVTTPDTAPTNITGVTTICRGMTTRLTATGGAGDVYEWGTGTDGQNIIAGANGQSINASPDATVTYWVRRVRQSPCSGVTNTTRKQVVVTNPSAAPTGITVSGSTSCPGTNRTLTATISGTPNSGATYQWGTGEVSDANAIATTTARTLVVAPSVQTTYWVRIKDNGTCFNYTATATGTVSVTIPSRDPATFGDNTWNVYGYSTADLTLTNTIYLGSYVHSGLNFDSTSRWAANVSPSNASGWSGCPVPVDQFTFVAKRKGFTCGTYRLQMVNCDDAGELYIDGVRIWNCTVANGCNGNISGTYELNENSTVELRVAENYGNANASLIFTNVTVAINAPAQISATNDTVCNGGSTTLTASGGTTTNTATFQWGTGTVGNNIIPNENSASITVSPTSTTTYWVRRISACGTATAAITKTITLGSTVAGTLSTIPTSICKGTKPKDIVLSGQIGSVIKWQTATNAAFTTGVIDINSTATTLTSEMLTAIIATTYYRAVVQNGNCSIEYTAPLEISIPADAIYQNGVWSSTPTEATSVIILSDITLTENLHVCSCEVTNNAVMTIGVGQNLVVVNSLIVDPSSNIIVEDQGSIVQISDDAVDIGKITVKRKTTPMKNYDFSYWSSPVLNNTLFDLSPLTRYDKYYSYDPIIDNYVTHLNGAAVMEPGLGYLLRAPAGWSVTNQFGGKYEGTFHGIPNNGLVTVPFKKGAGTYNLIGNPYPSAIDIDLFLTDPNNINLVNGTIYLWTHNTAISSTIPGNQTNNYSADDYAKYNLTGGVQSASAAITGGRKPDGKVASGQSFFIETKTGLANGNYTVNFRNYMRVIGHNDTFYKVGGPIANVPTIEKNRLWINVSNAQGAYNEILLGYITGATNEFDNLYDGYVMDGGGAILLYSLLDNTQYAIQGRQLPFDDNDVIPLGYKSTVAGNFTIQLEQFDGLFDSQNVYLIDHLTHATHNLKNGDYTFTTAIGTFDTRFEIVYKNEPLLGTDDQLASNQNIQVIAEGKTVKVKASKMIGSIAVFDLLGRQLYNNNKVNALEFKTNEISRSTQTLIVKVILENGFEFTQKVIAN